MLEFVCGILLGVDIGMAITVICYEISRLDKEC
jgi:hypothetical protein